MSGLVFSPGAGPRQVRAANGDVLTVPTDWELLPPGDATLTRRVKAAGEHWTVQERHGRRMMSRGVWTAAATIARIRSELEVERSTEKYQQSRVRTSERRDRVQREYEGDFLQAVRAWLNFPETFASVAEEMARRITVHATPIGSGTVARTKRIPIERRAEAAVIAWMRHQTTGYDAMVIPREKGARREVRRLLARRSQELLNSYRRGVPPAANCPLRQALETEPAAPQ